MTSCFKLPLWSWRLGVQSSRTPMSIRAKLTADRLEKNQSEDRRALMGKWGAGDYQPVMWWRREKPHCVCSWCAFISLQQRSRTLLQHTHTWHTSIIHTEDMKMFYNWNKTKHTHKHTCLQSSYWTIWVVCGVMKGHYSSRLPEASYK